MRRPRETRLHATADSTGQPSTNPVPLATSSQILRTNINRVRERLATVSLPPLVRTVTLLAISSFIVLAWNTVATADPIFSTHAMAGAYGEVPNVSGANLILNAGATSASASHSGSDIGYLIENSSSAFAVANPAKLLRTSASATGYNTNAGAEGTAIWRDVVHVLGSPPEMLRLNFKMDGHLFVQEARPSHVLPQEFIYFLSATYSVAIAPDFDKANELFDVLPIVGFGHGYPNPRFVDLFATLTESETFTSFTISDDWSFSGVFYVDVAYDERIDGYAFGLGLSSQAYAIHGLAISDALGTLTLQSVTRIDGTPIDVTFDSGMSFQTFQSDSVVPEPSSMAIFGIGIVCLGLRTMRRRGRIDPVATV